ncbi:MAG TPA: hypothetical protein VKV02_07485 [Acidobacteriaceae bacterium]|nr:hypothetical protein [Acidobacteriaceae bacterium]
MKTYQQIVRSVYGTPRASFWTGFSSALDLFAVGKRPAREHRLQRSDADALAQDWATISHDLKRAFERAGAR